MERWDFLVDRDNLAITTMNRSHNTNELIPGAVLLEIERFALTANNITYGVAGNRLGYWQFFPAAEPWGRLPVWGFARVVRSRAAGIDEGMRLYGYLPMSTHAIMELQQTPEGVIDKAPHRQAMSRFYNSYDRVPPTEHDDRDALLRPLFTTSFLLDDFLVSDERTMSATVLLSSASSKTALGLAWSLRRRGQRVVGLTSAHNEAFVQGTGLYADVARYDAIDGVNVDGPVVFVDFAGIANVMATVHRRFADRLVHSAIVGRTHRDHGDFGRALPGPPPTMFFAPDHLLRRMEEWGLQESGKRILSALRAFVQDNDWLKITHHVGAAGVADSYRQVLEGKADPKDGHVILPTSA